MFAETPRLGPPVPSPAAGHSAIGGGFEVLLGGWRRLISPADGPTCTFAPTCSGFAREAAAASRPGLAVLQTADRIMRDHAPPPGRYPVGADGRLRDRAADREALRDIPGAARASGGWGP